MLNQTSFAWKANSADSNEKYNTIKLNNNSCIADGNGYCRRAFCPARGSFSLKSKLLSVHVTGLSTKRGGNNIPVNNGFLNLIVK